MFPTNRWSGIDDGRFTGNVLVNHVLNDEKKEWAKKNIIDTDTLIIDEVSITSKVL
jgi:hypothetical protein